MDDFGVGGLLEPDGVASVASGKVNGKALQGRSVTESKIASDAASMNGFFLILEVAVEVVKPLDALI